MKKITDANETLTFQLDYFKGRFGQGFFKKLDDLFNQVGGFDYELSVFKTQVSAYAFKRDVEMVQSKFQDFATNDVAKRLQN